MPFEIYFFPGEGLLKFIFSWRKPFEFFFSKEAFWNLFFPRGRFGIFFSLYKPIKKVPKFIFLSQNLTKFIFSWGRPFWNLFFSWGRPLENYIFLRKAFWNLFFSRRSTSNFFFLNFLRPHPQIINGHPLTAEIQNRIRWCCISRVGFLPLRDGIYFIEEMSVIPFHWCHQIGIPLVVFYSGWQRSLAFARLQLKIKIVGQMLRSNAETRICTPLFVAMYFAMWSRSNFGSRSKVMIKCLAHSGQY